MSSEYWIKTKIYLSMPPETVAIDLIVQTIRDYLANNERPVSIARPTTPTVTPSVNIGRPRMFSGSGSFSTVYGSSPPPARPH
jgi:hypothetical protein